MLPAMLRVLVSFVRNPARSAVLITIVTNNVRNLACYAPRTARSLVNIAEGCLLPCVVTCPFTMLRALCKDATLWESMSVCLYGLVCLDV